MKEKINWEDNWNFCKGLLDITRSFLTRKQKASIEKEVSRWQKTKRGNYIVPGSVWIKMSEDSKEKYLRRIKESTEKIKKSRKFHIAPEDKKLITEQEMNEVFGETMNQLEKERGKDWQDPLSREEVAKAIIAESKVVAKEYCDRQLREKVIKVVAEGLENGIKALVQLEKERGKGWQDSFNDKKFRRVLKAKMEEIKNLG